MMAHQREKTDLFPTFSAMFGYPELRLSTHIHKNLVLRASDWGTMSCEGEIHLVPT